MWFEIKGEETPFEVVELSLRKVGSGIVILRAENSGGSSKDIMIFKSGGFCRPRNAGISGIHVDEEGRIMEEVE